MYTPKIVAGIFVGGGALMLIYKGYVTEAMYLLVGMLGFFVGEANGLRNKKVE